MKLCKKAALALIIKVAVCIYVKNMHEVRRLKPTIFCNLFL